MGSTPIFIIIIVALVITSTIAIVHASKDSKEINTMQSQISELNSNLISSNAAISDKTGIILQLERNNTALQSNISNMTSAYKNLSIYYSGGIITEPTLKQLKNFVDNYQDNNDYDINKYNCVEFSNKFIKSFKAAGYFGCTAVLTFNNSLVSAHSIVSVQTTDGLYYVEPQEGTYFSSSKLNIGTDYCSLIDCELENNTVTKISSCFLEKT